MVYRDPQIQKANLEILLLERQLRWVHYHGETVMLMFGTIFATILQILTVAFVLLGNKEELNHM